MIEEYLMNKAQEAMPEFEWTVNYETGSEQTATVYYEGGGNGDINNETNFRYPEYMLYFQSSKKNWDTSRIAAYKAHRLFHLKSFEDIVEVPELELNVRVYLIQAMGEPVRVGVTDDIMEYSLNLIVTLREEN